MPVCCGSSGTPFVQTRFLGASVVRFSSQADWNGTGGGLQVELVEDLCNGDNFDPPGIGMPVYFTMGGFTHGGILQNWKQNDSATGAKSYTVNVVSARDIVEGTHVILSSYNGPTMGVPNLANVYGWLEANYGAPCAEVGFQGWPNFPTFSSNLTYPPAPGFGGALNNEVGVPWQLILTALNAILNGGGGAYGSPITFRGHTYLMDLSELPLLTSEIRIGGENMTLEDMIARVCSMGGVDYFYDLITPGAGCGGSTLNIIKVRTTGGLLDESAELVDAACGTQIDSRLSLGTIGQTIAASTCVNRYGRGLELKMDVTNAFITGEFRQEIWQIEYDDFVGDSGGTPYACQGDATIWPYWGKNPDGTIIIGKECSNGEFPDDRDDIDFGHHFVVQTGHLGVGIATWDVTLFELRAALVSQGCWESWLWEFEPEKYNQILGKAEQDVFRKQLGDHGQQLGAAFVAALAAEGPGGAAADKTFIKAVDTVMLERQGVADMGAPDDEQLAKNAKLYDFVRKFAQEYYGRKFMVRLPFLCLRFNPDTPWTLETNWEPTDSGWTEWPVLGLPNPGWVLEQFRTDDGKIKCFTKFISNKPMILDNLSKADYFAVDHFNVFVSGTCDEIVWITPTDARAVVTLSGPIATYNPYGVLPEWLLGFALTGHLHGKSKKSFMEVVKSISNDKMAIGMPEPFILPVAAAVPLQSTRLVYGPWFAKKTDLPGFDFFGAGSLFGGSDKGKTTYQREAGFAPWHFGSWALMDLVAYSTASAQLGEQYVLEMGDITFPGAPVGSLGSLIAVGGPSVSQIDVQVGRGNGAVTTTYRMRTHTPDTGKIAKQRLDQIRHAAGVAQKAERMFKKHALDRLRNQFDNKLAQQLLQWKTSVGLSGTSSHDFLGGQAGQDAGGPALQTHDMQDMQHHHVKQNYNVTVQQPDTYEASSQDDEPHARTTATTSEARKDIRTLRGDLGHRWRRRAYMESIGMFRPFSTMPHIHKAAVDDAYFMPHWNNISNKDQVLNESSCSTSDGAKKLHGVAGCPKAEEGYMTNNVDFFQHEQVPPIFCKEQHLPINITTLSPFLSKGRSLLQSAPGWSNGGICLTKSPDTSKGHDIEYIARDGVYPTHLSVRHPYDNYSQNHWYRAIALRGPLVMAGWGFDIDNKPVPNESPTYPGSPQMKFEQDWLRKPQKWMCGPIDLRWDYKRNVWTAPSPMKIVKLELNEHLCVNKCANAILYHDQEQYDYDGNPLTCEGDCEKQGYKVKVYSNAMYPVPKGWRIMAYFDTTHNRYQMINHDPIPIMEVDITGYDPDTNAIGDPCGDLIGEIVGPAGACDGQLDPCDAFEGMEVKIENALNQPVCPPKKAFVWICGFDCEGEGDPGPTLTSCEVKCEQPIRAKGAMLQAEFKPECIITHLELMEFYCWGYDVTCDEEDITIYAQGDVETCWDWCFKLDGIGCVTEFSGTTENDTHSHTVTGNISGTLTGDTDSAAHTHTGTTTINSGGLHTHVGATVINVGGDHYHSGNLVVETSGEHTHTGNFTTNSGGQHDHSGIISVYSGGAHDHTVTGITSISGSHVHTGTGTTNTSGAHTPTGTVNIEAVGSHTHTLTAAQTTEDGAHFHEGDLSIVSSGEHTHDATFTTNPSGAHTATGVTAIVDAVGHTHSVSGASTTSSGAHDHTLTIPAESNHTHYIDDNTEAAGGHNHFGSTINIVASGSHNHDINAQLTAYGGAHSHAITGGNTSSDGTHSHDESTLTLETDGAHDHGTNLTAASDGAHDHYGSFTTDEAGGHTPTTASVTINPGGLHDHTLTAGYTTTKGDHNHTGTAISSGAHVHTITGEIYDGGAHTHADDFSNADGGAHYHTDNVSTSSDGDHYHTGSFITDAEADHDHGTNLTAESSGAHDHDGSLTTDAGGAQAVSGTVIINSDGAHSHTVTAGNTTTDGYHYHFGYTDEAGYHSHPVTGTVDASGAHGHTDTFGVYNAGDHFHTDSTTATSSGEHDHTGTSTTDSKGDHTHTGSIVVNSSGAHDHGLSAGSTDLGGEHTHTGTVSEDGAHEHDVVLDIYSSGLHAHSDNFSIDSSGAHTHAFTGAAGSSGAHIHTGYAEDDGDHKHDTIDGEIYTGGAHGHADDFTIADGGTHYHTGSFVTTSEPDHDHGSPLTTTDDGEHTPTGTIDMDAEAAHTHTDNFTTAATTHTHGLTGSITSDGAHYHSGGAGTTNNGGAHSHTVSGNVDSDGYHSHGNTSYDGQHTHGGVSGIQSSGNHAHLVYYSGYHYHYFYESTDTESAHSHGFSGFNVSTSGAHTHGHSLSVDNETTHVHTINGSINDGGAHTPTGDVTMDEVGSHTHDVTVTADGGHDHSGELQIDSSGSHGHTLNGGVTAAVGHDHTFYFYADTAGTHSHTLDITSGGAHTHNVSGTTQSDGTHYHALTGHVYSDGDHYHSGDAYTTGGVDHDHTVTISGVASHTHDLTGTTDNEPAHDHSGTTSIDSAGSHTHTGTLAIDSDGAHTHPVSVTTNTTGDHDHTFSGSIDDAVSHTHPHTLKTDAQASHAHETTTYASGYHNHEFTGPTNVSGSHDHSGSVSITALGSHTHTATFTTDSDGAHTHNVPIGDDGGHDHSGYVTTNTEPGHTHSVDITTNTSGTHTHTQNGSVTAVGSHAHNYSLDASSDGDHTHTLTINYNGDHWHSLLGDTDEALSHTHTGAIILDAIGSHAHTGSFTVDSAGAHTHNVPIGSDGGHIHTGSFTTDTEPNHFHTYGGGWTDYATPATHQHTFSGQTTSESNHTHTGTVTITTHASHTHMFRAYTEGAGTHSHLGAMADTSGTHTHGLVGNTTLDGAHGHTGTITIDGVADHEHSGSLTTDSDGEHYHSGTVTTNTVGAHSHTLLYATDESGAHTHTGDITMDEVASHYHTVNISTTNNGDHDHVVTGVTNTVTHHIHSGETTIYETGSHTHTGNFTTDLDGSHYHVGSFTVYESGAHIHTGIVTVTEGGYHHHTGTIDIDTNYHSHPLNVFFSGTMTGLTDEDTHNHEFIVPEHEVDLCFDSEFDLDIDSRFVPSPCVIRIAVMNKNFWEYYWYALCICTRAIWHEAEFGPAKCEINDTPHDCPEECIDIECDEDPEYDCPVPVRNEYDMSSGEEVSWFGFATDTTLLDTQTTCNYYENSACSASASCSALSVPTLEECLAGSGCEVDASGSGSDDADPPDTGGTASLDNYCPDPSGNFIEDAFMRDFNAGLFDFIGDDAGDHIPEGQEPF